MPRQVSVAVKASSIGNYAPATLPSSCVLDAGKGVVLSWQLAADKSFTLLQVGASEAGKQNSEKIDE
jgi:hypothetical protein